MKTPTWRARARFAVPVAIAAIALTACGAPPPGPSEPPGPTPTPWLAPGCIDSSIPTVPDFQFSGVANEAGNAHGFDIGGGVLSDDGSCDGTPTEHNAIVRANDLAGAVAACAGVGEAVVNPPQLANFGYAVPIDAWACVEGP